MTADSPKPDCLSKTVTKWVNMDPLDVISIDFAITHRSLSQESFPKARTIPTLYKKIKSRNLSRNKLRRLSD